MTHPFPLSNRLPYMKALDVECRCGVAHNGIIRLTSDRSQREYSDTALFIAQYMARMLHGPEDLRNEKLLNQGQRGPNARATRASGPCPHPLPHGFSRIKPPGARCTPRNANPRCTEKQPGAQPDCFQIPQDHVFTM